MSVTISYNCDTGRLAVVKGKLQANRPQRWTVTARYQTPSGPQSTTMAPNNPCLLAELGPLLEQQIRKDRDEDGGKVWGISWIATSR